MSKTDTGWFARLARFKGAACAVLVVGFAYFNASRGIEWSSFFHPDELPVSRWIGQTYRDGYISDRIYPGGWFVLKRVDSVVRRNLWELSRHWDEHVAQDGPVVAVLEESFENRPVRGKFEPGTIQEGRDFNVLLLSLSSLLLFLAAREIGAGPIASALAGLLFSVQPFLLEHTHYCETDMAPVFSLCLAGWLALRAVVRSSPRWCLAACAAAGFSIACKYTFFPVLVWIPALAAVVSSSRASGRRAAATAKLAGLGALAAAVGFAAGTPAMWMDPGFFFREVVNAGWSSYGTGGTAVGAGRSHQTGSAWRAASLVQQFCRLDSATLLFFAACIPVWFVRGRRKTLAVFPLFMAAFIPCAVFALPWIRCQETLPLLPGLCLGAAPLLAWSFSSFRRTAPVFRKTAAAAAVLLFAFAACCSCAAGFRMLSCFQRRDTRAECQNWLAETVRPGVGLAVEPYVKQATRGTPCGRFSFSRSAATWPKLLKTPEVSRNGFRYALRNGSYAGRGGIDDDGRAREARFREDCLPLVNWSIAPGGIRPTTFSQPDVELWALPAPEDDPAAPDVPLCLDRPLYFSSGLRPLYVPGTPSPGIGPVRAVATVGLRHSVHPPVQGPAWALSRVWNGPKAGSVVWEGLFSPLRAPLSAAGISVARLDEGAVRRAAATDVRPKTRVRLCDADDQTTLCVTCVLSDPAEVLRSLLRAGEPAAALSLFRSLSDPDAAARTEAFLASVAAGEPADPSWVEAARAALTAFDAASGDGVRVRGVPLRVLRDFATVRTGGKDVLTTPGILPVFLPAGRYRVTAQPLSADSDLIPVWFEGQEGPLEAVEGENGSVVRFAVVRMARDGVLRTTLEPEKDARKGGGRYFRALSVEWDPFEQLERAAGELRRALDR